MSDYDAIIIGAGHNGLSCAAYLARGGLRVKVLERRNVVGGAAVTEDVHPGFRNSLYACAVSLLSPRVMCDLSPSEHGLTIIERPAGTISLLDGDHLNLPRDQAEARRERSCAISTANRAEVHFFLPSPNKASSCVRAASPVLGEPPAPDVPSPNKASNSERALTAAASSGAV